MVFTTQIFLFVYFPICMICYYIADRLCRLKKIGRFLDRLRFKDLILIAFSLGFYMWSCFDNVFRLLLYVIVVYILALWIAHTKSRGYFIRQENNSTDQSDREQRKLHLHVFPLIISVALVIFCLIYFNYTDFLIACWNSVFGDSIPSKSLVAPLGLSFITFSAVSYLTDIYRGDAKTGSFIDCLLYLTFFPKMISGPIVLWKNFANQIKTRRLTLELSIEGIHRIMIGFAKKVILADTFGACLAKIQLTGIDQMTAFGTLVLYMLQIYYDFSGYSDIALGLSKLFGFEFKENFNFPYRSKSISEFWRRWHISLGRWFREYVYFPLGGSRKGKRKTLWNLAVVFALTGIWHGAGWNYILWGVINGACVILERVIQDKKLYQKTPSWLKYCATMLIVLVFWQFFRYQSMGDIATVFGILTGVIRFDAIPYTWQYYFDAQILTLAAIGAIGSTLFGSPRLIAWYQRVAATKAGYLIQEVGLLAVFVLAILFMVNSTYSPFIYFQY